MEHLTFKNRLEFRSWLEINYAWPESIWLVFYKLKKPVFCHDHALEEALCFGWIDSLIKRIDDEKYIIKFSKRRNNSKWSARNKELVEKLQNSGMMTSIGLKLVEEAKKNGKWDHEREIISDDKVALLKEKLKSDISIQHQFTLLSASTQRLYTGFYFDAKKEETREKRLKRIIESIKTGKIIL